MADISQIQIGETAYGLSDSQTRQEMNRLAEAEQNTEREVSDLKSIFSEEINLYGLENLIGHLFDSLTYREINGVLYVPHYGGIFKITGTSSVTNAVYNIYDTKTALPNGMLVGEKYKVLINSDILSANVKIYSYDSSENLTPITDDITSASGSVEFSIPSNAVGMRISLFTHSSAGAMDGYCYINIRTIMTLPELQEAINDHSDKTNLFDSSKTIENKRLDGAGALVNETGYYTSEFISVSPGAKYVKNSPVIDNYHKICVYDSTQTVISGEIYNINEITIHENGAYVRFCGATTEMSSASLKIISAYDIVARDEIKEADLNIARISDNENRFDTSTADDDKRINANGATQNASGYFTSAMIAVVPGMYVLKNSPIIDAFHRMAIYDSTGTFIPGELYNDNLVLMPSTAAYIRFCGKSEEKETAKVNIISAFDGIARNKINKVESAIQGTEQVTSLLGSNGVITKKSSVAADEEITITTFPRYLKKNTAITFYGKFSSFSGLLIGKGYNTYRGDWVDITASQIIFHHYESSDVTKKTVNHELTIADYLMVMLFLDENGVINCTINTTGGTFTTNLETDYNVFCGDTFAITNAGMTNVELSVSNGDTKKPVWFIGDSYVGLNADRVFGQLKALGFWGGYLGDGLAGLTSQKAFAELNKLLEFGSPRILIWYLGMNDSNSDYLSYMTSVKEYCEEHNIILILNKVPSVPNKEKETIGGYIDASGCRFINSYEAVGASVGGTWYTGYLAGDNVHPTQLGAKALAMRVIVDVPELMEYGFNQQTVSGDTTGDQ